MRKVSGLNLRDEEGFGLRPNIGVRGLNPTRSTKVLLLEDGIPLAYAPYGDNASYYHHPPIDRFEQRLSLFAAVKNIADKHYIVDRTRGIQTAIPRLIQVGAKYEF